MGLTTGIITAGVIILFIVAFMVLRMSSFIRPVKPVEPVELVSVDATQAARHLSDVIKIKTVSTHQHRFDPKPFEKLHQRLRTFYPQLHQTLELEMVGNATLLYTWRGQQPELKPVLFTAHQDVVPADPDTLAEWTHEPFSGEISEGYIWGRGTLDIKSQMIAALEAVEKLVAEGFQPQRTVYLAYGEDEEIGGQNGAKKVVEALQARGVHLAAVLDEGGTIVSGVVPSVQLPVALVGVAEKGHLSLKIQAAGTPGHSSMPEQDTAIGRLARALTRLEGNQMPVDYQPLTD
jgi:carboxypeptidase PM20D1